MNINLTAAALACASVLCCALPAIPDNAALYAENSKLAKGKWVKVQVNETGIQFISAANLKKFGFADPSKVRVFGLGGRNIPDTFKYADPDDLPTVPQTSSARGLWFFGFDNIRWEYSHLAPYAPFSHTLNPYSEESWYFLSDSVDELPDWDAYPEYSSMPDFNVIDSFVQPVLHEQDLFHPSNTGSRYLGEDFRSPTRRSFEFRLTDPVADEKAYVKVAFASNTSGSSSVNISANGSALSNNSISLPGISDTETFMRYGSTVSAIPSVGNNLKVDLAFQGSGSIKLARLDYIEVQYRRRLALSDGELYFNTSASAPSIAKVEGVDASTVIWDITDPYNPSVVKPVVSGSTASFVVFPGYKEFVAFSPDKCNRSITAATPIANQNLHALDIPDMLIITPPEYRAEAERLAVHHQEWDGLKCITLSPQEIYNEFSSGVPNASAFRRLLKMWHDRGVALDSTIENDPDATPASGGRIKYCLIFARPTFDNKMKMETTKNASYPFIPIWQSPTGEAGTTSFSTDDFIGMLSDTPSFDIGRQRIDVAVGRFPAMSVQEASSIVDKYIDYVTSPATGSWRNRVMMVADDQNYADHLKQSEDMIKTFSALKSGNAMRVERLYLDAFPLEQSPRGSIYPQAKEKMLRLWNDGVMMINYIGHASTVSWTHEDLLNWTDMTSFSNKHCPFLYAATCEFGRYDGAERSGAETLWAYPSSGIIATVTPSRSVYIDMNGKLSHEVASSIFATDDNGLGRRIGDIFREAKNNYPNSENTNKLRYVMIGNPAMRLPIPPYEVSLSSINGVSVDAPISWDNYPVLKAQGKALLEGVVLRPDGSPAEDFSGLLEIHLYDAESPVTTFGNGAAGVVWYYNDRKTLLYHGVTKVVNGKWSTTALLPSEIENNFSPAQFMFYAADADKKLEAHGSNTRFYIFGYDEDADVDVTGPDIEAFALNRSDFVSGSVVHSSPVVLARVSDPSGINLSDAGIGHTMSLVLDDKTYFSDVNSYYTPDPDDITAGSVSYPIADIPAGRHTLRLVVWDNAKNSSSASIDFEVAVAKAPEIFSLSASANPAKDHTVFQISTDRPMASVTCLVEVFDLNGKKVWSSLSDSSTDIGAALAVHWNLCDQNGSRVPRGIYIYRATITAPDGTNASKSDKLAVAAP